MSDVFLTREEIEHPYANLAVMLEDKRRKNEQMRKSVFAKITASPETLAEKFVYRSFGRYDVESFYWFSTICEHAYNTKVEALTATLEKLLEEAE